MPAHHPLSPPPSSLDKSAFMARYGHVYEHSPWIAEATWQAGLDQRHDTAEGLAGAMAAVLSRATSEQQLALLRAHPELAGKAAIRNELTVDSSSEQSGAGLDQCTAQEFEQFQTLNHAYNARFGFPFIIAVRGLHRTDILRAFSARVHNPPTVEIETAIEQVNRIALLRLQALALSPE
ncbi:2-oxo-4-hydroxy-4-carboxy-5-ureidoimidazoline decarboxylase [Natronocella acetinitrilica]|nr:2-oxo-4-hydroxy-4-carboxy-5-ureidoimidazoline decarboxylase [Natronocella acetinitrilica]